jgi:D-sedoheptulose 7-phosphate isomerase
MNSTTADAVARHLRSTISLLHGVDASVVGAMAERLGAVPSAGGTVFTLGNGGSAGTASHAAADWTAARRHHRPPLRVWSLADSTPSTTAISNDHGYDQVFVRQLEVLLRPEDVVVGISASGTSRNCVVALELARDMGAATIGLLGGDGGDMAPLCDDTLVVPSPDPRTVEDCHLAVVHALADALAAST